MYVNNADGIRETLCFFMDEKRGQEIAFVQFPQNYENITKNDIYANVCCTTNKVCIKQYLYTSFQHQRQERIYFEARWGIDPSTLDKENFMCNI